MRAFLEKDQVKQYIYNAIFDKMDDNTLFKKKSTKDKVKIFATDINKL